MNDGQTASVSACYQACLNKKSLETAITEQEVMVFSVFRLTSPQAVAPSGLFASQKITSEKQKHR